MLEAIALPAVLQPLPGTSFVFNGLTPATTTIIIGPFNHIIQFLQQINMKNVLVGAGI